MDKQSVADADDGLEGQSEDKASEQDPIDAALAEFDKPAAGQSSQSSSAQDEADASAASQDDGSKETLEFLRQREEQRIREESERDISAAIKTVKGDLEVDESVVRDLVFGRFTGNEAYLKAWEGRKSNPQAFERVLKGIHDDMAKTFSSKPGSDDIEAAKASVRGIQRKPASQERDSGMLNAELLEKDDHEFAQYKKKLIAEERAARRAGR